MRILLAWELGDNFGHAAMLIRIGEELASRGHDVFIALQDVLKAAPFKLHSGVTLLPAPYGRIRPGPRPTGPDAEIRSYADDVGLCGYDSPEKVVALIRGWNGLFDLTRPDLLIADAAPTALIAAQGREFRTIFSGLGYGVPPMVSPLPALRYWEPHDAADLLRREEKILSIINQAQTLMGRDTFPALCDAIVSDARLITTFEELDHYPVRDQAVYTGPFMMMDRGEKIGWDEARQKRRVFAYLYPGKKSFKPMVEALQLLAEDTILVSPGLSLQDVAALSRPGLRILTRPVQIDMLMPKTDLFVSHGGGTTVAAFLLAGVPQFMAPGHIEQLIMARRINDQSLGELAEPKYTPQELCARMRVVMNAPACREAVAAFAARYSDFNPQTQMQTYLDAALGVVENPR